MTPTGVPREGRSGGCLMARCPREARGSLKRLQSKTPGSSTKRLVYSSCPSVGPAATPHPHLCPGKRASLLAAVGHMETNFTAHSLDRINQEWQQRPPLSPHYVLHFPDALVPAKAERTVSTHLPQPQRRPRPSTKEQGRPQHRGAKVNDRVSPRLSPFLNWFLPA